MLCTYFNDGRETKPSGRFRSVSSKTSQFKIVFEKYRNGFILSDLQYSKSVATVAIIVILMLE